MIVRYGHALWRGIEENVSPLCTVREFINTHNMLQWLDDSHTRDHLSPSLEINGHIINIKNINKALKEFGSDTDTIFIYVINAANVNKNERS